MPCCAPAPPAGARYHRCMTTIPANPLVPVAFALDHETAAQYASALEAAGIEAHVRIEDGAHLAPMGSAYGALASGQPFVYPVLVSRLQRRSARRVLDGLGAPSETTSLTPGSALTAAAVVLGTVVLVLVFAWARGDI